jgi:hypothetical protein
VFVFAAVSPSLAQQPAAATSSPAGPPEPLTLKERLGAKWTDEQRIDNCKVPVDKRGSRPRPHACPTRPTGSSTQP